jgi:hypothetical protein
MSLKLPILTERFYIFLATLSRPIIHVSKTLSDTKSPSDFRPSSDSSAQQSSDVCITGGTLYFCLILLLKVAAIYSLQRVQFLDAVPIRIMAYIISIRAFRSGPEVELHVCWQETRAELASQPHSISTSSSTSQS